MVFYVQLISHYLYSCKKIPKSLSRNWTINYQTHKNKRNVHFGFLRFQILHINYKPFTTYLEWNSSIYFE